MIKKLLALCLTLSLSMTLAAGITFADELTEVQVVKAHIDQNEETVEEINEPISNWTKVTLQDGSEVKIVTDNSVVTLKDAEGNDQNYLNCRLSQKVRRDEIITLTKADGIETDEDLGNVIWIHGYGVANGQLQEMRYEDIYPATQAYSIYFNGHFYVSEDFTIEDAIVLPDYDENPDTEGFIYLQFEYGLEEQEAIDAIAALPEASQVTSSDEELIKSARAVYDGLEKWKTTEPADPDIQNKVTNYSKLVDCEIALENIKSEEAAKETVKTNANKVIDKANKLKSSDYTADSYKAVQAAKTALEKLLSDESATSAAIDTAASNLNKAINNLKKKQTTVKKKTQPMTVKAAVKKVSFKKLKKGKITVKAITVKKNKGAVTYKKISGSKQLTINKKTGKITINKNTKKGTYKIKVKITAAGNNSYKAGSKTVNVKIQVK